MACDVETLEQGANEFFCCLRGLQQEAGFAAVLAKAIGVSVDSQTLADLSANAHCCLPPGMILPALVYATAVATGGSTDTQTLSSESECIRRCLDGGLYIPAAIYSVVNSASLGLDAQGVADLAKCLDRCMGKQQLLIAALVLMAQAAGLPTDAQSLADYAKCVECKGGGYWAMVDYLLCSSAVVIGAPVLAYVIATTTMTWTWNGTNPNTWRFYDSMDGGVTWTFEASIAGANRTFGAPWLTGLHRVGGFDASLNRITAWSNLVLVT